MKIFRIDERRRGVWCTMGNYKLGQLASFGTKKEAERYIARNMPKATILRWWHFTAASDGLIRIRRDYETERAIMNIRFPLTY
jgi:hypothetical protein